jgi:hypothetical protein
MNDIYGSAEALASRIRTGFYLHVNTSSKEETEAHKVTSGTYGLKVLRNSKFVTVKRSRARYRIRDAGLKQLSQVGITNPALLVWELIPYSFVFDWIIPVGDFLGSLDALVGVENLLVGDSYTVTSYHENVLEKTQSKTYVRIVDYSRFVLSSSLLFPKLSYKPSKSLTAVANGVALLRQLRK